MIRRCLMLAVLALAILAALDSAPARAYWYYGGTWNANPVMTLQLSTGASGRLIDGSTSWDQPVEAAMAIWNQNIARVQYRVVWNTSAGTGLGNSVNNVFWSSTIYGRSFEQFAAYSLWQYVGNNVTEADVIFNNALSWNSYRGNHIGTAIDIRRLALHELGHVLGLDHPNDHGQVVNAVMNSSPGNTDTLMADDIAGGRFLYAAPAPVPETGTRTVSFPPRNESLDFRNQLEVKYRDGLRRGSSSTFVDREGDIVWISEYYRYRVHGCSHSQAQDRVFAQIANSGTTSVCGGAAAGTVAFPPRNEALQFRTALEAKYRDELRRGASQSAVDNEGDVVWIQEYLRYRVNSCGHAVAVDKVFAQIDGRGVQPVCS